MLSLEFIFSPLSKYLTIIRKYLNMLIDFTLFIIPISLSLSLWKYVTYNVSSDLYSKIWQFWGLFCLLNKCGKLPHRITHSHPINNHENLQALNSISWDICRVCWLMFRFILCRPLRVKVSVSVVNEWKPAERVKGHCVASVVNSRGWYSFYFSRIYCPIGKLMSLKYYFIVLTSLLTLMKN